MLPLTILGYTIVMSVLGQNDFYCNKITPETIIGVSEGMIITRESGQATYSDSLECVWKLDAGDDDKWIQLSIESLDLQWTAQYASCMGYDYMDILDGFTENSILLTSICHARNPQSVISKGRYLYLKFSSTNQNFYNKKGIEIRFKVFSKEDCPPGWFQDFPTSPNCFMIGRPGIADFLWAQSICNLNRGNLASINTQAEYTTILNYGRNISGSFNSAWLGLSDLVNDGTFAWVDRSASNDIIDIDGKTYNTHCVSMDFETGKGVVKKCSVKLNYICKALKDGNSILYQAKPTSPPPEEDHNGTNLFLIVILVVVFVILTGVGVVIYLCYFRKTGRCSRHNSPQSKRQETGEERSTSVAFNSVESHGVVQGGNSQEPSAPRHADVLLHDPQMVAPPTYDEAQYHPITPANY